MARRSKSRVSSSRKNIVPRLRRVRSEEDMRRLLSDSCVSKRLREFKVGTTVVARNTMDKGKYRYILTKEPGVMDDDPEFRPAYSPAEMLRMGVFEGRYINDCIAEFPREWYLDALDAGTLRVGDAEPTERVNYFGKKSRLSLREWEQRGWIVEPDNRGWFQWYCRYWLGRRIPEVDATQIERWKAFRRHYAQVVKNCRRGDKTCRPRQRQALLQWSWDIY